MNIVSIYYFIIIYKYLNDMKSILEAIKESINESSEKISSLMKGFVKPDQYTYSDKCSFSEEEVQKLIDLQPDKNIKIAKSGSVIFDYSTKTRADVIKFIHNNDRYLIRRASQGMGFFTKNGDTVDEHPLYPNKNSTNKHWFDSFDDMYDYVKKYLERRNKSK